MGRILVIGAGGVSTVAVKKIAMNADIFTDIMVASRTKSKCDRIAADIKNVKVQTAQVDADNVEELVTLFNSFKPDLVVNLALPYQDLHIHFSKGMQHLNGQEAMEVVRFRHNNDGSGYGTEDIGRMQTQQAFLKTVASQMLTVSNLGKVGDFVKIFQQYVDTTMSLSDMAWFGTEAIKMGSGAVEFSTLPGEWDDSDNFVHLDPDATLKVVNQYLNPYVEDRVMADLNIPA